ncbi:hypothetical protein ACFE04_009166 [Oxalis oulophora]
MGRGNDTIYTRNGGGNGSEFLFSFHKTAKKLWWEIMIPVTMFTIIIALGFIIWRKFNSRSRLFGPKSFEGSNCSLGASSLDFSGESEQELPQLSFVCLASATDNFSQMNKLGEGGFGAVYKVLFSTIIKVKFTEYVSTICYDVGNIVRVAH